MLFRNVVISLILLVSPCIALAGEKDLEETVRYLAGPQCAGRYAGSPGGALARQWLIDAMTDAGLAPIGGADGFATRFSFSELVADSMIGRLKAGNLEGPVYLSVSAPWRTLTEAPLQFWAEGEDLPTDAAGKLLLRYGPWQRGRVFSTLDAAAAADKAGAVGLLIIPHPSDQAGLHARYLARTRQRDQRLYCLTDSKPVLPVLWADAALGKLVSSAGLPTAARANLDLPDGKTSIQSGWNLAGSLGGPSDRVLLFCAHYDHLGTSDSGYFPGADDNAAAVAVLLETARRLRGQELGCEVRILFADAEELGLLGSQSFLQQQEPPDLMINLDTIGRGGVEHYRFLRQAGAASDSLLMLWVPDQHADLFAGVGSKATSLGFQTRPAEGVMFARGGDHWSFARAGIPACFIFGGFHEDYNTEQDLPDRILTWRLDRLSSILVDFALVEAAR